MAGVRGTPCSPTAYIHRAGLSEWLTVWEMPASFAEDGSWGRESRRKQEKREGARQPARRCGLGRARRTGHTSRAHPGPHSAQGETCSQHRGKQTTSRKEKRGAFIEAQPGPRGPAPPQERFHLGQGRADTPQGRDSRRHTSPKGGGTAG